MILDGIKALDDNSSKYASDRNPFLPFAHFYKFKTMVSNSPLFSGKGQNYRLTFWMIGL